MKLSVEFLKSNPILTTAFVHASVGDRQIFFQQLKSLASKDLSLAHSTFKISSCRTILLLSEQEKYQTLANTNFLGGFSVHKPFDSACVNSNNCVVGTKHWITNLDQAEFGIIQLKDTTNEIKLFFVDLLPTQNGMSFTKNFSFFSNPGLNDTCTGDIDFNFHPVELIFSKSDARYFVSNNHNSLCFITNYLGGIEGLLDMLDHSASSVFRSTYKNLCNLLDKEVAISRDVLNNDNFWHSRNALYLDSKNLMVEICKHIVSNCAGNFYNLNSSQGQHFFNCLVYSGHNGPVTRSYQQLFTEPQDY